MAQIKITSDVKEVKKSILGLSKDLKNLGQSKVALFTAEDRKFLKGELKRELSAMHGQLARNRAEIEKMLQAQKGLVKGSKEEAENRLKLLQAYKTQQNLFEKAKATEARGAGAFGGGGGTRGGGGMLSALGGRGLIAGLLAAAGIAKVASFAGQAAVRGGQTYAAGASNRLAITGLGASNIGPGQEANLARVGLTEDEANDRRVTALRRLGRRAGSAQNIMQQSGFERSYGLEGGSLLNTATALRANFGGEGADDAQRRIQASIIANGLDEALGPYLESMTGLLDSINENGISATDEVINVLGSLQRTSGRTAEQNSKAILGLNSSIKGSSGESNAFLQQAFAEAGIGGGRLGGTQDAISGGGITGLNAEQLAKEGYNPELIKNLGTQGFLGDSRGGVQARASAILKQIKGRSGLSGPLSSITSAEQYGAVGGVAASGLNLPNADEGFRQAQLLEQVAKGGITGDKAEKILADLEKGALPEKRLEDVNKTLSGLVDVANSINKNVEISAGALGGAKLIILGKEIDTGTQRAAGVAASAADKSGLLDFNLGVARGANTAAFGELPGAGNLPVTGGRAQAAGEALPSALGETIQAFSSSVGAFSRSVGKLVPNLRGGSSVTIRNGDGTITDKTTRQ